MATIRDIARHCGVSAATVSKALNGYGDIAEATRDRILREASELHYRIDVKKTSPASRKCKPELIGWVMQPDALETVGSDCFCLSFFRESIQRTLERKLLQQGHEVLLLNVTGQTPGETADHIRYRGVRHVMDFSGILHSHTIRELETSGISVFCPEEMTRRAVSEASGKVTEYLLRMGHRRILCAVPQAWNDHRNRRPDSAASRAQGVSHSTSASRMNQLWAEEFWEGYRAACNAASVPELFLPFETETEMQTGIAQKRVLEKSRIRNILQTAAEEKATAILLPDPAWVRAVGTAVGCYPGRTATEPQPAACPSQEISLAAVAADGDILNAFPEVTSSVVDLDKLAEEVLTEFPERNPAGKKRGAYSRDKDSKEKEPSGRCPGIYAGIHPGNTVRER